MIYFHNEPFLFIKSDDFEKTLIIFLLLLRENYYFERFFVKNPSNSLKTFRYFATMLQNDKGAGLCPAFEGLREAFFKNFPFIHSFMIFISRKYALNVYVLDYRNNCDAFCKQMQEFRQSFRKVQQGWDGQQILTEIAIGPQADFQP